MLVSGMQQNDLVIHKYFLFFITDYKYNEYNSLCKSTWPFYNKRGTEGSLQKHSSVADAPSNSILSIL